MQRIVALSCLIVVSAVGLAASGSGRLRDIGWAIGWGIAIGAGTFGLIAQVGPKKLGKDSARSGPPVEVDREFSKAAMRAIHGLAPVPAGDVAAVRAIAESTGRSTAQLMSITQATFGVALGLMLQASRPLGRVIVAAVMLFVVVAYVLLRREVSWCERFLELGSAG